VKPQLRSGETEIIANDHVINKNGRGQIVLVCEHASNAIPAEYSDLGLDAATLQSHIAWDPGALSVAKGLSQYFDTPLVTPAVSRLVYDCNRHADVKSAIPERSENHIIPGNVGISSQERKNRAEKYYKPFRDTLISVIEQTIQIKQKPIVVTIHSFTPVYAGIIRDFDLGILHDADARLADKLLDCAKADGALSVMRNQPYGPEDDVTYTLIEHAVSRGLLNVMIEIRNDLISNETDCQRMVNRLAKYIEQAVKDCANDQ